VTTSKRPTGRLCRSRGAPAQVGRSAQNWVRQKNCAAPHRLRLCPTCARRQDVSRVVGDDVEVVWRLYHRRPGSGANHGMMSGRRSPPHRHVSLGGLGSSRGRGRRHGVMAPAAMITASSSCGQRFAIEGSIQQSDCTTTQILTAPSRPRRRGFSSAQSGALTPPWTRRWSRSSVGSRQTPERTGAALRRKTQVAGETGRRGGPGGTAAEILLTDVPTSAAVQTGSYGVRPGLPASSLIVCHSRQWDAASIRRISFQACSTFSACCGLGSLA
jgi:hypothetical protein